MLLYVEKVIYKLSTHFLVLAWENIARYTKRRIQYAIVSFKRFPDKLHDSGLRPEEASQLVAQGWIANESCLTNMIAIFL